MFKIVRKDQPDDYAANAVFIRLANNGCYVECEKSKADGVCVKQLCEYEQSILDDEGEETGEFETISAYQDTVYRFGEGRRKTEQVCRISEHNDGDLMEKFREDTDTRSKLVTAIGVLDQKRLEERYEAWDGQGVVYTNGSLIMHDGILYETLQTHTSQEDWSPIAASSLFAAVLSSQITGEIAEWVQPDSTNAYMTGDKVLFEGTVYVSLIDNNVWSPAVYPAGWQAVE